MTAYVATKFAAVALIAAGVAWFVSQCMEAVASVASALAAV